MGIKDKDIKPYEFDRGNMVVVVDFPHIYYGKVIEIIITSGVFYTIQIGVGAGAYLYEVESSKVFGDKQSAINSLNKLIGTTIDMAIDEYNNVVGK